MADEEQNETPETPENDPAASEETEATPPSSDPEVSQEAEEEAEAQGDQPAADPAEPDAQAEDSAGGDVSEARDSGEGAEAPAAGSDMKSGA
jgi:hypothetical protein